jgi:hypothetical protein
VNNDDANANLRDMTRESPRLALLLAIAACGPGRADVPPATDGREHATPPGLHEESAAFDRQRNRFVLFGGIYADSSDPGGYSPIVDTYEWDGERWLRGAASPASPPARALAALEYDPRSSRVILLGGITQTAAGETGAVKPCPSCQSIKLLDDVWSYDGDRWTKTGTAPAVAYPRLVFDAERQTMLLVGNRGSRLGTDGEFPVLLWREENGTWILTDSTGPRIDSPPRPSFDAKRGVLVLPILEGPDAGVWEWNGRWKRIDADRGPEPRERVVTTYDETREVVMLFGGRSETRYFNDLWSWNGQQWTHVTSDSAAAPSPRSDGSLTYEPSSKRLILIGGLGPNDLLHRETWVYAGSTWTRVE